MNDKKVVYITQTLGREDRAEFVSNMKKAIPGLIVEKSVNGYDKDETLEAYKESGLKFVWSQFKTYGVIACFFSKFRALRQQIETRTPFICLLEDDTIILNGFVNFVETVCVDKLLEDPFLNFCQLNVWSACYVFSLAGAERIVAKMRESGIIHNIDQQINEHCGPKIDLRHLAPIEIGVTPNQGDCLKTESFDDDEL